MAELARQLAAHLAGPPIDIYDYAVLDLNLTAAAPIPVAAGRELVTPTSAELRVAMPVSAAAPHQRPCWDPDFCGGLAMLRRIDPHQEPVRSSLISLDLDPAHRLWEPLLALSLEYITFDAPRARSRTHPCSAALWRAMLVEPGIS